MSPTIQKKKERKKESKSKNCFVFYTQDKVEEEREEEVGCLPEQELICSQNSEEQEVEVEGEAEEEEEEDCTMQDGNKTPHSQTVITTGDESMPPSPTKKKEEHRRNPFAPKSQCFTPFLHRRICVPPNWENHPKDDSN